MKTLQSLLLSTVAAVAGYAAELAPTADRPDRPIPQRERGAMPPEGPRPAERGPGAPRMPNLKREKVTHLGVGVAPAGPNLAAQLGFAPNTGLVVNEVAPESPAQERIKAHDVLVELDGRDGGAVALVVSDDGPGMPEEVRARFAPGTTTIRVHPFAADAPEGWEPTLDHEHVDHVWLSPGAAEERLFYPEPRRAVRAAFAEIGRAHV
mgnify:CR=1 FL=1